MLQALGNFALYFGSAVVLLTLFKFIYVRITPHDEWQLIKEETNSAAAIAFGGAVIGFALALSGAISNSVSMFDYLIWALVALIAQLMAFALVRFVFMPRIVSRIQNNELSAGIMVAATSVAIGLLNAASMTY